MLKKIILTLMVMIGVISCTNVPRENLEEKEIEQVIEYSNLTGILEKELTKKYFDKGIESVEIAAYSKGIDIILLKKSESNITREEFNKYAQEITKVVKERRETPEADIKVYLDTKVNNEVKTLYKGTFY